MLGEGVRLDDSRPQQIVEMADHEADMPRQREDEKALAEIERGALCPEDI